MSTTGFITLVSGLPRSGTSMMMKMLEAGGQPVLCDHFRQSDEDNLQGYYEFERVKKVKEDKAWLPEAEGKAVKMIYKLLYDLPRDYHYRVLFMRRELDEVVASQNKMLARHGKSGGGPSDAEMVMALFREEIKRFDAWVKNQPCFQVLDVDYNQLVGNPRPQVTNILRFLDRPLDADAMCQVVDPALYRNRR
jgi:hypothetical protein